MFKWMLSAICVLALVLPLHAQALPGTKLLKGKEDFAKVMVEGIGKWLDRETAESVKKRQAHWKPDYSSLKAYGKSVNSNRERFKKIIGLVDQRTSVCRQQWNMLVGQRNRHSRQKPTRIRFTPCAGLCFQE